MELILQESYEQMQCRIYLKEDRGAQTVIIGYDGERLIEQTLPNTGESVDFKPLLTIPLSMKDALIKAFISEGAKTHLRTENENLLKEKLEAVELHLNDMRVFSLKLLDSVITRKYT